jgi:glycosyltransferase involved in cell wall biosynthesis
MKVFIFGTGQFYKEYSAMIYEYEDVVGLLDNDPEKWNSTLDGRTIYSPNELEHIGIKYDWIILLSVHMFEMYKQLIANGISNEKIMNWREYFAQRCQDKYTWLNAKVLPSNKKKVLIVTTYLNYDGGSLVAVYAAMILKKKGYDVVIAAPTADDKLIREFVGLGIGFMLRPTLPYVKKDNMSWIRGFDIIIVNVLQMIQCACEISRIKPTIWWLHESSEMYPGILGEFYKYTDEQCFEDIHIWAVSNIARNNFHRCFPNKDVDILTYGIPDEADWKIDNQKKERFVFAVIGCICEGKGQDIFIEAANQLNCVNVEFWIIGKNYQNNYGQMICEMADQNSAIRVLGEMTRKQMKELYHKIDVVVCSSWEETMSITMTEGMMYGKTCIVSNNAGMADYVDDGKNGFVFECGNANDLCTKMRWCIENRDELGTIGQNARKTYEEVFTIEKFGDRLEKIVKEFT